MEERLFYYGTGKRKSAIARVRLYEIKDPQPNGKKFIVNGRPIEEYFGGRIITFKRLIEEPLILTNTTDKFNIIANIRGGGVSGQAGALRHGIAKALAEFSPDFAVVLRKNGCLKRDPRVHERKKYGRYGRRRGFQWTKR